MTSGRKGSALWAALRPYLILVGAALLCDGLFVRFVRGQPYLGSLASQLGAVLLFIPLCVRAYESLRSAARRMDELVALAVLACFALGDYTTAGVVALLMLGAVSLEEHTASGAWTEVESLLRLSPKKARRVMPDGTLREVDAQELSAGDCVRILPGDTVPADGTIQEGSSALIEGTITGESLPAEKTAGDPVYAGTANTTGVLTVVVDRVGEDTTLARVKRLILSARKARGPVGGIIDRYVGWYPPVVVMVAALVLFLTDDWHRAISAIVASCPIALVLAVPSATVGALAACYRKGLLVKRPVDLETATGIDTVVVDKTGTLTFGDLEVVSVNCRDVFELKDVLGKACAVARQSQHPVAKALVAWAQRQGSAGSAPAENVREEPGRGLVGTAGGCEVRLGRPEYLEASGIDVKPLADACGSESGYSALAVAVGGQAAAVCALADRIRPEARGAVEELRELGIERCIMVTGDRAAVAQRTAQELSLTEVVPQCLPDQKLALVEDLKRQGRRVLVAGDGINDAPALASGDVGVAFSSGASDIALQTADVVVVRGDLRSLGALIRTARRHRSVVTQNLLIGVVLILSGLFLATFGYLTPIAAALLQNAGAGVVLLSSGRLVGGRR